MCASAFDADLSSARRNLQPQANRLEALGSYAALVRFVPLALAGLSFAAEHGASTADAVERLHAKHQVNAFPAWHPARPSALADGDPFCGAGH